MGLQMQAEKKRRNRRRLSLFKETYQMSTRRPNTEDRFAGRIICIAKTETWEIKW